MSCSIGLDATDQRPQMHLLGGRNIAGLDGQTCPPTAVTCGVITWLEPSNAPAWTWVVHRGVGNLALGDGSVAKMGQAGLRQHCALAAADTHANCALRPDVTKA